jgi:hypothetical protein
MVPVGDIKVDPNCDPAEDEDTRFWRALTFSGAGGNAGGSVTTISAAFGNVVSSYSSTTGIFSSENALLLVWFEYSLLCVEVDECRTIDECFTMAGCRSSVSGSGRGVLISP